MYCKNCEKKIPEESMYCNFCGHEIKNDTNHDYNISKAKEITKKKLMLGVILFVVLVIAIVAFFTNINPKNVIIKAINEGNYEKMIATYEKDIKGNVEIENEIVEKVKTELDYILNEFKKNKITYEEATSILGQFSKLELTKRETDDTKREIANLNNSRASFKSANKFENEGNYLEAIKEYKKVIENDTENFTISKNKITELADKFKEQVLAKIEEYNKEDNYKDAISLIDTALKIMPQEQSFSDKKIEYDKLFKEQMELRKKSEIEELKSSQKMIVTRVNLEGPGFLNSNHVYVTVKNISDKVVKEYKVGILTFDYDGYPVTPSYENSNISYGRAEANIKPKEYYGNNAYWTIFGDQISKVKACVIEVQYYDDSKWTNEYFDYWIEEERRMF